MSGRWFSAGRRVPVLAAVCAIAVGCASGPSQQDIQEGALFLNPETDADQHLADIDACNLERDEQNPTGEQVGIAAAGLILGGLPGLMAMAMANDEQEATLYNTCMAKKGYLPVRLSGDFAGRVEADNGGDDVKELVPEVHAQLSDPERAAWAAAQSQFEAEGYEAYLAAYPSGFFSEEARQRALSVTTASIPTPNTSTPSTPSSSPVLGEHIISFAGEITAGTVQSYVPFCTTGATLRGELTNDNGDVTGVLINDRREYPVRGKVSGNTISLNYSNTILMHGSIDTNQKSGKIVADGSFSGLCDGVFAANRVPTVVADTSTVGDAAPDATADTTESDVSVEIKDPTNNGDAQNAPDESAAPSVDEAAAASTVLVSRSTPVAEPPDPDATVWKFRGRVTDGNITEVAGFCVTGGTLTGDIFEKDGAVRGRVTDQDGHGYTLRGKIQGNSMVLRMSNIVMFRGTRQGTDDWQGAFEWASTYQTRCDGKFTLS